MNLEKSQLKYLLVLALVAVTLPMAAWLASRPQLIQKQAACAVNIKLNPAAGSYAKNAAFSVNVQIEAGTAAVAGADVNFSFDATKLKVNSITLPSAVNTEIIKTINNTNGTARISGVKMSAGGVTGTFNFATIAFEGLAVTSAPTAVTLGSAEVTATGEGAACTVGTKTNGAYTITSATTPTNTPPVQPTPTPTGSANSCTAVAFIDVFDGASVNTVKWGTNLLPAGIQSTGTVTQSGGKLNMNTPVYVPATGVFPSNDADVYTKALVSGDFVAETTVTALGVSAGSSGSAELAIDNMARTTGIHLAWRKPASGSSYVDLCSAVPGTPCTLGRVVTATELKLKLVRTGSSAQGYVDTGSGYQSVGTLTNVFSGNGTIMMLAYNFPVSTVPITASFDNFSLACPTGGAARMVNLAVKLRGIDQPPTIAANQLLNFKVKFTKAGATPSFFEPQGLAPVTGNNWTIVIPADTLAAGQYEVYIKGPKHLQKKFPKVVLDGSASQTIDLTTLGERYYLEPGDLAISGTNHDQQDGVVNVLDMIYMMDTETGCITKPDDPVCLAKADLNLDGLVSSIDMELMNGTVYSKWEDEVE